MNMIVAFCKKRGIGYKNKLPWHIPNELKFFKKTTMSGDNNVVVMGKNTWNSLPKKPLKNRKNLILSRSLNNDDLKKYDNTLCVSSFELLDYKLDKLTNDHTIWLIGGKSIYDYYIEHPKLEKIYITYIHHSFPVDVQFPKIPIYFDLTKNSNLNYYNNIIYNYATYKNNMR